MLITFKVLMCGFQADNNYVKGKMNHKNEIIRLSKSTERFLGCNCVETIANLSSFQDFKLTGCTVLAKSLALFVKLCLVTTILRRMISYDDTVEGQPHF